MKDFKVGHFARVITNQYKVGPHLNWVYRVAQIYDEKIDINMEKGFLATLDFDEVEPVNFEVGTKVKLDPNADWSKNPEAIDKYKDGVYTITEVESVDTFLVDFYFEVHGFTSNRFKCDYALIVEEEKQNKECICPSLDLFRYGCKCGFLSAVCGTH